jgi:Uma2 family endonuclease
MITMEEVAVMGINAPRPHQRIIAKLTTELSILFYAGTITLEALPETMIDESQSSPVPDVILVDEIHDTVPVIIEIAHGAGVQNDLDKVRRLINTTNYGIIEGFVYDYKRLRWYKYHKTKGDILDSPSFCDLLNLDIATLL